MTSSLPQFPRPPITEALIEVRCDLGPQIDWDRVKSDAVGQLGELYPHSEDVHLFAQKIQPQGNEVEFSNQTRREGLRLIREDRTGLVQFLRSGFTINQFPPYTNFDDLEKAARPAWDMFRKLLNPVQISQLAVRFINRIEVPAGEEGAVCLSDYTTLLPAHRPDSSLQFAGIFQTLRFAQPESGEFAQVVLATEENRNGALPVLLDIEAFKPRSRPVVAWNDLHEELQMLRDLKNLVFANSLTDKCRNLFQ